MKDVLAWLILIATALGFVASCIYSKGVVPIVVLVGAVIIAVILAIIWALDRVINR